MAARTITVEHIEPNSNQHRLERNTREWIERFGLAGGRAKRDLFDAGCGTYAALVMPRASRGIAQLCSDYFAWLIAYDDAVGERASVDELRADMRRFNFDERSKLREFRFGAPIADILARASALRCCPSGWTSDFLIALREYVEGCIVESEHRHLVPSPFAYSCFRNFTIGMEPIFLILELAHPSARRFRRTCYSVAATTACWLANDYFSWDPTVADGDPLNVASVLRTHCDRALSVHDALSVVAERYELCVEQLLDVIKMRSSEGEYHVLDCVRGNTAWYATSPRYAERRKRLL